MSNAKPKTLEELSLSVLIQDITHNALISSMTLLSEKVLAQAETIEILTQSIENLSDAVVQLQCETFEGVEKQYAAKAKRDGAEGHGEGGGLN